MQSSLVDVPQLSPSPSRPAEELRALLALAAPLAAANLGQVLIGAVDTAIVGRLGELELGAAGLGNTLNFTAAVLGLGVMLGLDLSCSGSVSGSALAGCGGGSAPG
jgi:Na+-driven multidrug efflux pump